jgi:hypothetical protein
MDVCGGSNSVTISYPYTYFYNPTTGDLSHRTCVKSCPNYNSGTLSTIDCYIPGNLQGKCSYDATIGQNNGNLNTTVNTTAIIGY